jgi:hypothetical protein
VAGGLIQNWPKSMPRVLSLPGAIEDWQIEAAIREAAWRHSSTRAFQIIYWQCSIIMSVLKSNPQRV